jgi:hypothetical protein
MEPKMGIQDLWSEIKSAGRTVHVSALKDTFGITSVAGDAVLNAYRYYCAMWSKNFHKMSTEGILELTIRNLVGSHRKLAARGIETVWCFDGDKTVFKTATQERVLEKDVILYDILKLYFQVKGNGDSFSLTCSTLLEPIIKRKKVIPPTTSPEPVDDPSGKLFRKMANFPIFPDNWIEAVMDALTAQGCKCMCVPSISEAEKLCTILCMRGMVQAVHSCDSDTIPLGAPIILKEIEDDMATVFINREIKTFLGMTQEQILNLSIILGSDFNERIPRHGIKTALKLIRTPDFKIEDFEKKHGKDRVRVEICRKYLSVSSEELELANPGVATAAVSE